MNRSAPPTDGTAEAPSPETRTVPGGFAPLLVSLSVLFVLYPLLLETGYERLLRGAFILVLVGAVYSLSERRRMMLVALALAAPTGIAQAAVLAAPSYETQLAAVVLALAFVGYVCTVVFKAVFRRGRVTGEKIAGAVSVYLLLGLAWSMVYALISLLQPGAFHLPADFAPSEDPSIAAEYGFLYYSFVTLTTLGYGDIVPVSAVARMASWVEAVIGQLYLAILLARLVALQIMHGLEGDGGAEG